jgi:hypothetical protein
MEGWTLMLRIQDFHCGCGRRFEKVIDVDTSKCVGNFDAVRSENCPSCGELAPAKIGAPKVSTTVSAVEMGGRLYRRDDIEEKLAEDTKKPSYFDSPEFEARFSEAYKRNEEKAIAGTLPPAYTEAEVQAVAKEIKE